LPNPPEWARICADAAYARRQMNHNIRPRMKGQRLPTLAQVLKNRKTQWRRMRGADGSATAARTGL
jgi:hypothetical protein